MAAIRRRVGTDLARYVVLATRGGADVVVGAGTDAGGTDRSTWLVAETDGSTTGLGSPAQPATPTLMAAIKTATPATTGEPV